MERETKGTYLSVLALFTSSATLVCCALPILLVMLGLGATLAFISTHFQWLTMLSRYQFLVFLISGLFILMADWFVNKRKPNICTTNLKTKNHCQYLMKLNRIVIKIAVVFWSIGFISAYFLVYLYQWIKP